MIENLLDLRVFVTITATGSQAAAAKDLGLSLAVVSKRLASLEKQLGVRLFNRTTRSQSLTTEGLAFHEHCVRILNEVENAELMLAEVRDTITGLLTITAPRIFGRKYVIPLTAEFKNQHPELNIRLNLTDEVVDLVQSGVDVAFRFGPLQDSSMSAKWVGSNYRVLCASPDFIKRYGMPKHPSDLQHFASILYGPTPEGYWIFNIAEKPVVAKIKGTFIVNDGEAALALALAGAGILFKSIWDIKEHLQSGRLVQIMPEISVPTEPLNIMVPYARQLTPRVRHFVDFAVDSIKGLDIP